MLCPFTVLLGEMKFHRSTCTDIYDGDTLLTKGGGTGGGQGPPIFSNTQKVPF